MDSYEKFRKVSFYYVIVDNDRGAGGLEFSLAGQINLLIIE